MSADPEDVKPKLNITVNFEGSPITIKVKANTSFKKIFDAAEKRFQKDPGTLRFVFEGVRLTPQETPADRDMEDGDVIDAHLEQLGGGHGHS